MNLARFPGLLYRLIVFPYNRPQLNTLKSKKKAEMRHPDIQNFLGDLMIKVLGRISSRHNADKPPESTVAAVAR
jgi:hypothetical protein